MGNRIKRQGKWRALARSLGTLATFAGLPFVPLPALFAQTPAVIKLWDYHVHDKKFRQNIFKDFNKATPDIKVEYTSQISSTYVTVFDAAVRSGTPPDIFVSAGAFSMAKMLEMGWIIPLDDIAPTKEALQKWMARFPEGQHPFLEDWNVFSGKVYSWPTGAASGIHALYWNVKLFREAGLKGPDDKPAGPETWAEMRQDAKKITELGQGKVYGIIHGVKNPGIWDQDIKVSLAPAAGYSPSFFDFRTGRWDFKHPGFRGAVQLWMDMSKDGSVFPGEFGMDDEQAKFKFSQDLAGMIFGGPWVPGGLLALTDSLEFDAIVPPVEQRGVRKGYLSVGNMVSASEYLITSKTKSRNAVWKVVEFMTSAQYQEGWVKAGGGFSVFPEYNKPEYFAHPTIAKQALWAQTQLRDWPGNYLPYKNLIEELFNGPFNPGQPNPEETITGIYIGKLGWEAMDDLERRWNDSWVKTFAEARKQGANVTMADWTFPDWDMTKNFVPRKP